MSDYVDPSPLTPIQKLTKDLREASRHAPGQPSARFLRRCFLQDPGRPHPIHTRSARYLQATTDDKVPEPHDTIAWLFTQEQTLENQIKAALDVYGAGQPAGVWMRSIVGIGPVITAGFLAHIDAAKAPTVGHIWRFCGLDPTVKWDKGTKRPWNASLKRLCWIVGESFTKVSNHADDTYGKLYQQRKEREIARNEAGDYAEQAAASAHSQAV